MDSEGPVQTARMCRVLGLHCPHMPEDTFSHGAVHKTKTTHGTCEEQNEQMRRNCHRNMSFEWPTAHRFLEAKT